MPLCKITRLDCEAMRAMRADGMALASIGVIFGVGHRTVSYNLGNERKTPYPDPAPTTQQIVTRLRSIADGLEKSL